MTTFEDKEGASENKYARDRETEFRIHARRNKLLGLWAAAKMGLSGTAVENYAKSMATADFGAARHEEAVLEKVKNDLAAAKVTLNDHDIRTEMYRLLQSARKELTSK